MLLALALLIQEPVDQKKIDAAIEKGIKWLRRDLGGDPELVLWTFVHAHVPANDADFEELLKKLLGAELTATYRVSLQAMILEEVDRVKYQERIYQCAQFLVDNQNKEGSWGYGETTEYKKIKTKVETGGETGEKKPYWVEKPKVTGKIDLKQQRVSKEEGDNSNSQYAMLGLRACHDAGISLPRDVIKNADEWWRKTQQTLTATPKSVETGGFGTPRGWGYKDPAVKPKGPPPEGPGPNGGPPPEGGPTPKGPPPYGSMTAGAAGGLMICDYLLEKNWEKDKDVKSGLAWLTTNFSVTENPGAERDEVKAWYYYYLYALERACILYDPEMEKLGTHVWYAEGAKRLLELQEADGAWKYSRRDFRPPPDSDEWNTCFSILFLRRSTRALVATGGKIEKK